MISKIKAHFYHVPFIIKDFWPYYHENLTNKMKELGFELGTIQYNTQVGDMVTMLRNDKYEYIYQVINKKKLQGGDFFPGTDHEFDLKFSERIKRRDDK